MGWPSIVGAMLQMGLLGDRAPGDDDVICAICHRPIAPNEGVSAGVYELPLTRNESAA